MHIIWNNILAFNINELMKKLYCSRTYFCALWILCTMLCTLYGYVQSWFAQYCSFLCYFLRNILYHDSSNWVLDDINFKMVEVLKMHLFVCVRLSFHDLHSLSAVSWGEEEEIGFKTIKEPFWLFLLRISFSQDDTWDYCWLTICCVNWRLEWGLLQLLYTCLSIST